MANAFFNSTIRKMPNELIYNFKVKSLIYIWCHSLNAVSIAVAVTHRVPPSQVNGYHHLIAILCSSLPHTLYDQTVIIHELFFINVVYIDHFSL